MEIMQVESQLSTDRPNHNLSYTVGNNFCLEDVDSLLPSASITLECLLGNEPDPLPEFIFTIETSEFTFATENQTILLGPEIVRIPTSNDSILQLSAMEIQSLFMDTSFIVSCMASNSFGSDIATTFITICGKSLTMS